MKINSSRFGEIEVDENLAFNFIQPILGYEHLSKFVLVDHTSDSPFKWLQSVEDMNIAFPVTIPGFFGIDYQFVIPEENAKELGVTSAEEILTFNIVCIPPGAPQSATVNLIGPIIVNTNNRNGMQLVLVNSNYDVKHRLFPPTPPTKGKEKVESKSL